MFEVKNADKRFLDSLESNEKAKSARVWKVIYNIFKTLGLVGAGVVLVNFGVAGVIVMTGVFGSIFVPFVWSNKICAEGELDSENDAKVKLAVELSSNLGVEIDAKNLRPELVAILDETEKATFVQDGQEIAYGNRGPVKHYYKYSDVNGDNHLLVETTTFYDERKLMPINNIHGYGEYITRVNSSHVVNGLESADEEALPREVVEQIANYEANQQQQVNVKRLRRCLVNVKSVDEEQNKR